MAQRQASPHPSASLATASKALCVADFPGSSGLRFTPLQEPGHDPIPSGHILQGRRINRSDPRRPAVPKRVKLGNGSEATGRSRRRSPDGPSTHEAAPSPRRPSGIGPHGQPESVPEDPRADPKQSRRTRRLSPSHAFAESRAQASQSTAGLQSSRVPSQLSPNPNQPPDQTPLDCLHLVSAHPPCSRKGPLLPACGLKCPRRVKRETTNSRFFCTLKWTLQKIGWASECGTSAHPRRRKKG